VKHLARIIGVCVVGLTLAGCASGNIFDVFNPNATSVLRGGPSIVAKTENPVSRNDIAAITLTYNGLVAVVNAYYARPICAPGVRATWDNFCSEPAARRELAKYRRKAWGAILTARNFRKNNPTISAVGLVRAAGDAVADLKAVATINGLKVPQ